MATKASLWRGWLRRMGSASERDITEARAWFDELYQAGLEGKYLFVHPGGSPLQYDEREVLELGLAERG